MTTIAVGNRRLLLLALLLLGGCGGCLDAMHKRQQAARGIPVKESK